MYKVMIVDDELMIRQGLQSLIEWKEYGFQIVALASNGVEAIDLYKEHDPDLILIDIRMPLMDGIRTIGELRQLGAKSRILILSGYGEFQYAQQAIRFKVDGYVMKPIDENELTRYIEKVSKELNQLQQPVISTQTVTLLREQWLKDFAEYKLEEAELSLDHWKRLFTHPFSGANIVLLDTYSREHSLMTRNTIKQQLSIFIEDQKWGYVFSTNSYIGILINQVTMNQSKRDHLNNIIELSCNHKAQFVAIVTATHTDLVEMYEELVQVKMAMKNRFFMHANELLSYSDVNDSHNDDDDPKLPLTVFIDQMSQKLFYVIDVGSKTRLDELLGQIANLLKNYCDTEQQMKSSWAQLLTIAMNRISAMHPQFVMEEDLKLVTQLYLTHHYQLMLDQLNLQLTLLMTRLTGTEGMNKPIMQQLIDFIHRHYAEPLRLETMADLFHYNSGYLGKLFKNHTGDSFHTYLDKVRIEHSIVLLREGYKVHHVAVRVGYANVDYFHTKFKKYQGVPPSAFKPSPLINTSTE